MSNWLDKEKIKKKLEKKQGKNNQSENQNNNNYGNNFGYNYGNNNYGYNYNNNFNYGYNQNYNNFNQNTQNPKSNKPNFDMKIPLIILGSAAGVAIIVILLLLNTVAYKNIYNGISVNGVAVGGKTVAQAQELLRAKYEGNLQNTEINLKAADKNIIIKADDIEVSFNYEEAANVAFNEGRKGNVFSRIGSGLALRMGKKDIQYDVTYNKIKLDGKLETLTEEFGESVEQANYEINDDIITITNGKTGKGVDSAKIEGEILAAFRALENREIAAEVTTVVPNPTNIDEIRNSIKTEAQNAVLSQDNGNINLVEHVVGRDFNVELAKEELAKHPNEGESFNLPLIITMPAVTTEDVTAELFKETLATYSSNYKTSEVERSENVRLAAQFIDDTILLPGEVFSYNERVGERSADRGFKVAKVYSDGEIVDGMGGGICQVSSTLYNAVLRADLEVVERRNHSLTISYVPNGTDATVSFGTIDFRFKNNKDVPIKIVAKASGGKLTTTIQGINKEKDKTVEIKTETISTTPPKEKIEYDETLPPNTTKVEKKGQSGMVVDTYKIIKKNGEEVSNTKIHRSTYRPTTKLIKKSKDLENVMTEQPPVEERPPVVEEKPKEEEKKPEKENANKNNNKNNTNKNNNNKIDNDLLINSTI